LKILESSKSVNKALIIEFLRGIKFVDITLVWKDLRTLLGISTAPGDGCEVIEVLKRIILYCEELELEGLSGEQLVSRLENLFTNEKRFVVTSRLELLQKVESYIRSQGNYTKGPGHFPQM